jgi:uncharacterized membrane protein
VLAALAAALMMYGQAPERIPTHWNIHGEIDGDGSRLYYKRLERGGQLEA